jgi:hypothetical protein
MKEVFTAANSAYTTRITMVLLPHCLIIKEFALGAVVITHGNATILTHLLCILLVITKRADDLLNTVPWNIMALIVVNLVGILSFIVTVTTIKDLIAAGGSNSTSSPVMLASVIESPN